MALLKNIPGKDQDLEVIKQASKQVNSIYRNARLRQESGREYFGEVYFLELSNINLLSLNY